MPASGVAQTLSPSQIKAEHVGRRIKVAGIVRALSEPRVRIVRAVYVCGECGREIRRDYGRNGRVVSHLNCQCGGKAKIEMGRCSLIGWRVAVLEEFPETGKMAQIDVVLEGNMFDAVRVGDRVLVEGHVLFSQLREGYSTLHLVAENVGSLDIGQGLRLSDEDIREILKLSKDPRIVERIANSIAPDVKDMDYIKLALALSLFGSGSFIIDGVVKRGEVHVLLLYGDSAFTTYLLKSVADLAPTGMYVNVAALQSLSDVIGGIEHDDRLDMWVLKGGAITMANGGVSALDWIDRLDERGQTLLSAAMELRELQLAKGNIFGVLKTRCGIVASARMDLQYGEVTTSLEENLLSNFDLVFPMHYLDCMKSVDSAPLIDRDLLRKYIYYARTRVTLRGGIYSSFSDLILERWMHDNGFIEQGNISLVVRISRALARMRLSNRVEREDIEMAMELMEASAREAVIGKRLWV